MEEQMRYDLLKGLGSVSQRLGGPTKGWKLDNEEPGSMAESVRIREAAVVNIKEPQVLVS